MKLRGVGIALGVSTAMVLLIAAVVPRNFLANDDIALTEYLRKDMVTPWISPLLAQALGFFYQEAPGVPWYGLYQYAVIVATGAALIHTCIELIEHRPGFGRIATMLGAMVICASHAILAIGITWTTVSISAIGTAVAAFAAHVLVSHAAKKPALRLRALVYGLLFISGYALRPEGLGAAAIALLPLLGWAALRFVWNRHIPRLGALLGFVAPFVIVIAVQNRIPQGRGAESSEYAEFNSLRGKINGQAEYEQLDTRAPQLLERAGWTIEEYRDFTNWLIIDQTDYPPEKLKRLLATGGAPEDVTLEWSQRQLRGIYDDSAASVALFVSMVIGGVLLAWLGVIKRRRGLLFSLGYLVFLLGMPLWMSAHYRFPQRVSLSFYTVAALGVFVFLAREIADRPADPEMATLPDRRANVALLVVAACLFGWARHLITWMDRVPWPFYEQMQALENRVVARNGFVFVYVQSGLVDFDPLRATPRTYEALQGGWATFSAPWYEAIARLGVHRGSEVLPAMLDNPDAYLLASRQTKPGLEDWIRRKVRNSSARLALVDAPAISWGGRAELYRVVTTPLVRGSDEWRVSERAEWSVDDDIFGPPSVTDLAFRTVAFAAPYEQYLSQVRQPATGIAVAAVDGGIRCSATGDGHERCPEIDNPHEGSTATGASGRHAGVHVAVNGLRAARFAIRLIDSENILSVSVYARTQTTRSIRWRWELDPQAQRFGYAGTFTLVPGYSSHRLKLAVSTAKPRDIRELHIVVAVKPGTHAGFELRHLEVAEP